jgi:hypothetical protein
MASGRRLGQSLVAPRHAYNMESLNKGNRLWIENVQNRPAKNVEVHFGCLFDWWRVELELVSHVMVS